jgi:hypothetical protein
MEWVLEEFDRKSGSLRDRYRLSGLADSDAMTILELDELGDADLYDVSDACLSYLAGRFGLTIIPSKFDYLLGRESGIHLGAGG